ncbi:hypothetical protein LPB140_05130 [Sphingorhabdus lutea]|uniref:Uncharacterized protein n=1 Tax=Sphingorhabdus lutea TaxID=1913578 RepID=A0A1L3JB02_9SPHN|nr:hypothetical protein [Sphingorhabdus lutea]APG62289.1 hypothetical protein LPB140_05130 [Sphingorhabdus lutea]
MALEIPHWACACEDADGERAYVHEPGTLAQWDEYNSRPRYVRIMLEYSSYGIYNGEGESTIADTLPISPSLCRDIERWNHDYQYFGQDISEGYTLYEESPLFPHDHFNRRGEALATRMREELGPEWEVFYQNTFLSED